jgi:hypothetical protein
MLIELACDKAQQEILGDNSREKILAAGRRWGKSTLARLLLIKSALEKPGSQNWYVAPTYSKAMSEMRKLKANKGFMQLVAKSYAQFPPRFELTNGSIIAFRSCDPGHADTLRGEPLACFVLDEAAYCDPNVYYSVLLPSIADVDGQAFVTSTFQGRGWFFELYEKGLNGTNPGIRSWKYPTSTGLAFRGKAGKERLAQLRSHFTDDIWRQEFEAEPLSASNTVFGLPYIIKCTGGSEVDCGQPGQKYITAFDIGRVVDSSFAITGLPNGQIVAAERFPKIEHGLQAVKLGQVQRRYNDSLVVLDSTGGGNPTGDPHVKEYQDACSGSRCVNFSRENKGKMVADAALMLEKGMIKIPKSCTELIAQLKVYQYKISAGAMYPAYSAPKGEHDDGVSAFLLYCHAIRSNWQSSGQGTPLWTAFS